MFDTIGTLVGIIQGRYDDKRRQNTSPEAGFSGRCLRNNGQEQRWVPVPFLRLWKVHRGVRRRRTQRIDSICYGSLLSAGFVSGSVLSGCAGGGYGSCLFSGDADDDVIGRRRLILQITSESIPAFLSVSFSCLWLTVSQMVSCWD